MHSMKIDLEVNLIEVSIVDFSNVFLFSKPICCAKREGIIHDSI